MFLLCLMEKNGKIYLLFVQFSLIISVAIYWNIYKLSFSSKQILCNFRKWVQLALFRYMRFKYKVENLIKVYGFI